MPLFADPVTVLPAQREALEQLIRSRSTPQQLALCTRMILHAADGVGVRESARELDVWPKTVRYWRRRWRQAADGQFVPERLTDAPRSGAPATHTPEQICAVIAMTCEKTLGQRAADQPFEPTRHCRRSDTTWVPSISQRSVGRFLEKSPISTRIASVTG
jgi:putative transposase